MEKTLLLCILVQNSKMRIIINLIILAAILGLAYLLFFSIKEPISFKNELDRREGIVVDRLENIKTCQEMYRDITGEFAPTFDTLVQVLTTDSIPFQQVFGDPSDPDNEDKFIYKTVYSSAKDSINNLGISLDSLRYVPFSAQEEFEIAADTLTYQKTLVPVCEVGTRYNKFMGPYADVKYQKYDDTYDPGNRIKFGDMSSPNLTGSWD